MSEQRDYQRESAADHAYHVWMNARQEERRARGEPWEPDLYEFQRAVQELRRLPVWMHRLRTNTLPTTHQQCSHSPTEPIAANRLICALGEDVATCPILASLRATFAGEVDRARRLEEERGIPRRLHEDDIDLLAARCCTWHILISQLKAKGHIDTSEGYVQDEGDRRFWSRVYDSLSLIEGIEEA